VPAACFDARLAALGVAAARAASRLAGASSSEGGAAEETADWERVQACVADGAGVPFSVAYVLAAAEGDSPHYVLADTATGEHLPVAAPPTDELARGLFVVGDATSSREQSSAARPPAFHRERRRQAEDALRTLRASGSFDGLTAFRDLEHRDLERALHALPPRLQPIARHLLTENRRVQKLVRAARTGDWQFFGALLLMSHASRRHDWWGAPRDANHDAADDAALHAVVEAAKIADEDGLYGACATGRGPCVLVVGRPAALPAFFRRTTGLLEERCDRTAEAVLI
jgi:galactokinase